MKKFLIVLAVAIVVIVGYFWSTYNKLVTANETIDNQWAQVETQYQRRFDLIPNLVSSVKGSMAQEQKVFGDLAEARSHYAGANGAEQKASAAVQVESSLSRLLAIIENYPQLKSSEAVQTLMVQLEGTENRISVERKRYNDTVKIYNVMIKRVPARWIASAFGFRERTYFAAPEAAAVAPVVDLKVN